VTTTCNVSATPFEAVAVRMTIWIPELSFGPHDGSKTAVDVSQYSIDEICTVEFATADVRGVTVGPGPPATAATVKVDLAEYVPSDTTTVCGPVGLDRGFVKVTGAFPLASVTVPGATVAIVPPTVTVSGELVRNPEADRLTEVPTGPLAGLGALSDGITVSIVAEAMLLSPVPSERATLYAPGGM
jgi:hypothetical protein